MNILPTRLRRTIKNQLTNVAEKVVRSARERHIDKAPIDPRITFPCFMPMDEFIDVDRLKSLDAYLMAGIEQHYRKVADGFFLTGLMTLDGKGDRRPGSREIHLSQSSRPTNYLDWDKPELWSPSAASKEFPLLMDFIATLPFKGTTRMLIMYDDSGKPVTAHRDHVNRHCCHEFIWFRPNLNKPFYVLNHKTGKRLMVDVHSAWFDSVNQFHGADGHDGLSVSIRVDGVFSDEVRARIPTVSDNRAATPALWASLSGRHLS